MKKNPTTVIFRGTPEQENRLLAVIEEHRGQKGAMMPILQQAQEIYGYLPAEVQRIVALNLGVSFEEVYGIVSFYSQFTLNPKGQYAVSVCLGTACYVKGSAEILEKVTENLHISTGSTSPDGRFSLDATRCVGACGLAPVMIVNNDVYGRVNKNEIGKILAKYK